MKKMQWNSSVGSRGQMAQACARGRDEPLLRLLPSPRMRWGEEKKGKGRKDGMGRDESVSPVCAGTTRDEERRLEGDKGKEGRRWIQ
jgi:hypothetical protein